MEPTDEVLPGQDRPPLRRGTRVALGVLLAIALLAAGVVALARDGDDGRRADRPTPSPSAPVSPSSLSPPPTVEESLVAVPAPVEVTLDAGTGAVVTLPPSPCFEIGGGGLSCSVVGTVPKALVRALRSAFPSAQISQVRTTYSSRSSGLAERRVIAYTHDQVLRIVISRGAALPDSSSRHVNQGVDVAQVTLSRDGYGIVVAAERAAGRTTSITMLRRLAADPRLLHA